MISGGALAVSLSQLPRSGSSAQTTSLKAEAPSDNRCKFNCFDPGDNHRYNQYVLGYNIKLIPNPTYLNIKIPGIYTVPKVHTWLHTEACRWLWRRSRGITYKWALRAPLNPPGFKLFCPRGSVHETLKCVFLRLIITCFCTKTV